MVKSDIFENFVKIAQEKGLIKDDHAEHTEKSFSETNPRMDSLSIEQISKLYNTKPDRPKEMDYKKNIIENAHPKSVVISPSYDKLNGLVENENEGQAIRARIVMKGPDGHLVNRKYAKKNLLLSLVRVANELDARNSEELRKLADVCLEQSSQSLQKRGFAAVIAVGVALVLGAVYAKQHLRFHSDGWQADYGKAMSEIDDLLSSNTNFEVGYSYTPQFMQTLNQLRGELNKLNVSVMKTLPILDKMQVPRNAEELKAVMNEPSTQAAVEAVQELQNQMNTSYPFINSTISNFGSEFYKQRAIANKGMLSSMVDVTEFLHGGNGLVADDFDDVSHALQTLKVDLNNLAKVMSGAQTVKEKAQQDLSTSQSEVNKNFTETPSENKEPSAENKSKDPFEALENESKGLFGGLLGK